MSVTDMVDRAMAISGERELIFTSPRPDCFSCLRVVRNAMSGETTVVYCKSIDVQGAIMCGADFNSAVSIHYGESEERFKELVGQAYGWAAQIKGSANADNSVSA